MNKNYLVYNNRISLNLSKPKYLNLKPLIQSFLDKFYFSNTSFCGRIKRVNIQIHPVKSDIRNLDGLNRGP